MKKVFIVTGEVSGDKLGAWYVDKVRREQPDTHFQAVGGTALSRAGVSLYSRLEDLNVVGVLEVVKKARPILRFLDQLATHIIEDNFEHVVLVDFPGFNLRLAKALKRLSPEIKITYLSPPQLWAWGGWRIKPLKKFCDRVIVLYPFEKQWYARRGLDVEWIGSPHYDRLRPFLQTSVKKEPILALLPGSRPAEIATMLPMMMQVVKRFKMAHSNAQVIIPLAESFSPFEMKKMLRNAGTADWGTDVTIISDEREKFKALQTSCLALAKPGTGVLELALLKVPTVVVYKTSWLTYFLARPFVSINQMSLPNLLLDEMVCPELIQSDFSFHKIYGAVNELFNAYKSDAPLYHERLAQLERVRDMLKGE